MTTNILKIEYISIESLVPYIGNARTHSRQQIAQLKTSISTFGFTNPILIDENGNVIAGHGRMLAGKELGMELVPTITIAGLNEDQKRALRISDNKIALNAGWDSDLLQIEIARLSVAPEINVEVTGFTPGEINVMLNPPTDAADDAIPAVRSEPRSVLGDIWDLGDHCVGCGDARDPHFVAQVVSDQKVDCAFMDPPWNVRIQGHANVKRRHGEFVMASGEMTDETYQAFLREALETCVGVSKQGAVHFICMDWRHYSDLADVGRELYGKQLNLCVWNKSAAGMGSLYRSKHELVFVFRVGDTPHLNTVAQRRLTQVSHSGTANNGLSTAYAHDNADDRTTVSVTNVFR